MSEFWLSGAQFERLRPLLPDKVRGVARGDDRRVLNGIFFRLRTGAPWAERFFNKLKHFRAVATRYDKRDDNYLASIKLASARIWMRFNESAT